MSAKKQKSRSARPISAPENSVAQLSLRLLQQLAVLLLAVLGFLFCLITSYELDLPTATLVWTAIAFSLLFLAVFSVRKSGLFALQVRCVRHKETGLSAAARPV